MTEVCTQNASHFLEYINSLGFLSSPSYESLKDAAVSYDDRKMIVELSKIFSKTHLTEWYGLTTHVYANWLFKNQDKSQEVLTSRTPRDSSRTHLLRPSAKGYHRTIPSNANDNYLYESSAKKNTITKINCLVLQLEKLVKKRKIQGFFKLLYLTNLPTRPTQTLEETPQKQVEKETTPRKITKVPSTSQIPTSNQNKPQSRQAPKSAKESREIMTPVAKKKAVDSLTLSNQYSSVKQPESTTSRTNFNRSGSLGMISPTSLPFGAKENYFPSGKLAQVLTSSRSPQNDIKQMSYEQSGKKSQEQHSFSSSSKRKIDQRLRNEQIESLVFRLEGDRRLKDRLNVVHEGVREANEMKGCTFVPVINPTHSRSKSKSREEGGTNPYERLYEDANRRNLATEVNNEQAGVSNSGKRSVKESVALKTIHSKYLTERVISTTDRSMNRSQGSPGGSARRNIGDTFNKLYNDKDVKTRNLRQLEQKVKTERGETFSPNISRSSKNYIQKGKEGNCVNENTYSQKKLSGCKSPKFF